jgi:hypothetical protein
MTLRGELILRDGQLEARAELDSSRLVWLALGDTMELTVDPEDAGPNPVLYALQAGTLVPIRLPPGVYHLAAGRLCSVPFVTRQRAWWRRMLGRGR